MDRVSSAKKYDSTNLRSLQSTPLLLNLPIASATEQTSFKPASWAVHSGA